MLLYLREKWKKNLPDNQKGGKIQKNQNGEISVMHLFCDFINPSKKKTFSPYAEENMLP